MGMAMGTGLRRDSRESRESRDGPPSTTLTRETTSTGGLARRARHLSLVSPVGSSPLSAHPMTTIQSNSDQSSEGQSSHAPSREPSNHDPRPDSDESLSTVPMTRSNSLPVLTLRELQALKQKDGELGIYRGGDWAWVSRERDESEDELS